MIRRREMIQSINAQTGALHPLANGSHTFSNGSITVSNENHIDLVRTTGGSVNTYASAYPLDVNTSNITSSSNLGRSATPWFLLRSGDEVLLELKNFASQNIKQNMSIRLRTIPSEINEQISITNDFVRTNTDKTFTKVIEEDVVISGLAFWWASWASTVSFDLYLYVNGVRYI